MRVLMISFDHTMLAQKADVPGDTRERHIKYAAMLQQRYPNGHLTMLVKTPAGSSAQPVALSQGLTVYPIPCQRWAFALTARRCLRTLFQSQTFDLITTQTPFDDGWLGIWSKHRFGIPVNVQMRSSFLNAPYWIKERPFIYRVFNTSGKWVAHRADSIRVVSIGEKQRLERLFPRLQNKIIALHPLVNVQTFDTPVDEKEKERVLAVLRQHGMEGCPFMLFVGRLVLQKNIPTLLKAFASILQQHPTCRLVIAGDGHLRRELEQLAQQLRVSEHVLWIGNKSLHALRGWYALARAMVLPSFHEGFGKVIVESYLLETPVVATPFVSAKELIQNGETGFVTGAFTHPEELTQAMSLLLKSPDDAAEMGKKGRLHIQEYLLDEHAYIRRLLDSWEQTAHQASTVVDNS